MKFKMMFGNPSVMDQNIRIEIEKYFFKSKIRTSLSKNLKFYVAVQMLFLLLFLSIFTLKFSITDTLEKFIYGGILIITLINVGALLEQRKWIYYLEIVRLFFFSILFSYYIENWSIIIAVFYGLLLMCVNKNYKKWYFNYFLKYQ